ncbi:MAG: hypothetical protein R3B70_21195 [Polyangiaceae bacterium]
MNKGPHLAQPPTPPGGSFNDAPSDLELMMFFDGELEEPRKSAVAGYVNADLKARSKLAGLRVASAIVEHEANQLTFADDIADRVMARIAVDPAQEARENGASAKVIPLRTAVTTPLPNHDLPRPQLPAAPTANDNSGRRMLVGFVALVAAAAAAFAVWSKQSPPAPVTQGPVAAVSAPSAAPSPVAALTTQDPEIDGAAVPHEPETEHGVEVAAVNFGAHMGSIFYVPSGSIEAKRTTTVVWLADDAGE